MELSVVVRVLNARVVSRRADLGLEVEAGAAADLMSDVLAFARPNCILLTGLTNPQVVRTSEIAGIIAVAFVRGKRPPAETIALADELGIPLVCTRFSMYESCGRLHAAGLVATVESCPEP